MATPLHMVESVGSIRPYRPPSKARRYSDYIRREVAGDDFRGGANLLSRIEYHRQQGLTIYIRDNAQGLERIVHSCGNTHREIKDVAFTLALCGWNVQMLEVYKAQNNGVVPHIGGELSPSASPIERTVVVLS